MHYLPTITDVFTNLEARLRKEKERLEPIPEREFSFPFELLNVDIDIQFDMELESYINEDEIEVIYKGVDVTPIVYAIAEILSQNTDEAKKLSPQSIISDYLVRACENWMEYDLLLEKKGY